MFESNESPVDVGSIVRCGQGGRIAQVVAVRENEVLMVLAGRVNKGEHTPPQRPMALRGTIIPGRNMVLAEGKGLPELYYNVNVGVELTGLVW